MLPNELPYSAASDRNRVPILAALHPLIGSRARALEIASGTGQHAAHFGAALPGWQWQPTDLTDALFGAIAARTQTLPNVLAPRRLDVLDVTWPSDGKPFGTADGAGDTPFTLVFCANLLHISPWDCTPALMRGAARHLAPGGWLVTYGPYLEVAVPTAAGNLAFDADLRTRNAQWGLRQREAVENEARAAGLTPVHRVTMPANNLLLAFRRD